LRTTASLTEFLGYDEPPTNTAGESIPVTGARLPVILPCFSTREGSATVRIWDNQTVLLGKLAKHYIDGDRVVTAEPAYFVKGAKSRGQPAAEDREVLVFITVTLVDAAGNRIHSEGTPPLGGDTIPPQSSN